MTTHDTRVRSFQMKTRADRQIDVCCPLGLAVAEGGPHRCSWGWLEPRLLGPAPRHHCQSFEPVPNPRASQNQLTDTGPTCSCAVRQQNLGAQEGVLSRAPRGICQTWAFISLGFVWASLLVCVPGGGKQTRGDTGHRRTSVTSRQVVYA